MISSPLEYYLRRYSEILNQDGVEEIMINSPGAMFIERAGQPIYKVVDHEITIESLKQLAQLVGSYSKQMINSKNTLLSASLPTGERVQIVLPPSCEPNCIYICIRY